MEKILKAEGLSFAYGEDVPVIQDVNLAFGPGERVVILGANGAGKSTLFYLLNGLMTPCEGSIYLDGRPVKSDGDRDRLRQRVGLVFQDPDDQIIAPTVETEISFGPMNFGRDPEKVAEDVEEVLRAFQFEALRHRTPHSLSGGEKKILGILGIVVMHPDILFFDEPTAGIDYANQCALEEILSRLVEAGRTLVISTHDMDFAWRFGERGIVMNCGEVLCDGPLESIFLDEELLKRARLNRPMFLETYLKMGGRAPFPKTVDGICGPGSR